MDPRPPMQPSRPPKVAELVAQAEDFVFKPNIPLKHWSRAAETLYQEACGPDEHHPPRNANFALSEGDIGRAYVMLYRHSLLVLNYLPKHPESKTPEGRKACRSLSKRVDRVLEDLEELKPEINNAYKEWERMRPADEPSRPQPPLVTDRRSYAEFAARDPTLSGNARILDASEHQDLAVDLARREITRRDTVRRATKQAGLSEEETLTRRRAGRWDDWDRTSTIAQDNDLQRQMEAARRNLDSPAAARDVQPVGPISQPVPQTYNYPSISKSRPVGFESSETPLSPVYEPPPTAQPARPPKQPLHIDKYSAAKLEGSAPAIPRKVALDDYQPLIPSPQAGPVAQQPPARPPKAEIPDDTPPVPRKERLTFKPGAYLENGDPIRSIFLPRALRRDFLKVAADNTRRGLEMCGILCGTPVNNALFIRCLLIPDQKCTSDTCETENESAMFDYCDSEDLLMIGWIHTHPTQTCFMSSRDLHTHAGYQIMMPESIAIVCAPKFEPSHGIFRLTNPPGLEHILQCNHTDTFHQHSVDNLYRVAEHPQGHVYETDKLPFYVHDLRTK
ncbi:unnamed protein product [Clonostachys rosea]|uniref:MPN domain-containing protein n=1 Tax=Bionectria ochroleuca TaxID=29856 RepID=A0ABY6TYM6_BIOOC|nr:unnamed protein product [Clonostachys rosea]